MEASDTQGAARTVSEALSTAQSITDTPTRNSTLAGIVGWQAAAGDIQRALSLAQSIDDDNRASALSHIARAQIAAQTKPAPTQTASTGSGGAISTAASGQGAAEDADEASVMQAVTEAMGREDYAKALELARPLANRGIPIAQFTMGLLSEDDTEAARWFRLAADQGSVGAQVHLGRLYYLGSGVPQVVPGFGTFTTKEREACVFRWKPIAHSSPNRSLIPFQADHPFRSMPITDSSRMPIIFGVGTGTVGGV